MLFTKLSAIVKSVRLRYAIPFVLLLIALYWFVIHPLWMTNWGSTAAERQMALPGDNLLQDPARASTLAITIAAPPDIVWQWLAQIGQDRAGFYSYTWLENLLGVNIHNTNEIRQQWQRLAVGDGWRMAPPDYLWGLGKGAVDPVLMSDPGHALVLKMFGAHILLPLDAHTTRLVVRGQAMPDDLLSTMMMEPMVFTMERRMLLGLKARAEGCPDAPAALGLFAQLGWAGAGFAAAALFVSRPRRRYWLLLPLAAALPALLFGRDPQAALAAFLAVGIPVLGFLIFGRSWWGSLLVIGSLVMLTLLLAPDAYIVFGLAFALLLLAALGVMIAARATR